MNKNKQVLIFLNVCILVLACVTTSYAYFKVAVNNTNNMVASIQTDTLSLTFSDGNPGFNGEIALGGSITKTFIVENTGNQDVEFELLFKHLYSDYTADALSYTFSYSTNENGSYIPLEINETLFNQAYLKYQWDEGDSIYGGCTASITKDYLNIPAHTTYHYKLILTLNNLEDVEQDYDIYSTFSTTFDIKTFNNITKMMKEIRLENIINCDYYYKYEYYNYEDSIVNEGRIRSITILNSGSSVPKEAIESWDMSALGDGSVIAYVMLNSYNEETESWGIRKKSNYDLYFTANGQMYANSNSNYMLSHLSYEVINNIENINTSYSKDMSYMFKTPNAGLSESNITSIDLSSWDTSNVTNMTCMFQYCTSLIDLNISNFNTSKVTDMSHMFECCWNLANLDLKHMDTSNVTDMSAMFWKIDLPELDLSNFNTSKVRDMSYMFDCCWSLTNLDLSNFDTSSVTNMIEMFYGCESLISIDLSNFNTSNVTDMSLMFDGCNSLTSLDVSNFNTSNVTDMGYMFRDCQNLIELDLSNFDTSNVTNMKQMFYYCKSLSTVNLSNFETLKVTNMIEMFYRCNSLTNLDLSNFNTSKVTDMSWMFYRCYSLTNLDLSNFNTSNVTNMSYMFDYCNSLTNLDLSSFNTSNVTTMRSMFYYCEILTNLDLSNFNTSNVTNMGEMFRYCSSLTTIYVSNLWNTSSVTSSNYMFAGCTNLLGGSGTTYNSPYTEATYAHVDEGPSNPGYLTLKTA